MANNTRIVVCKNMFSNTLGISEKTIHNWITGATCGIPKSKTGSGNSKGNNERRESAREYLQTLPTMPSHYCRSSSNKNYLEPLFASIRSLSPTGSALARTDLSPLTNGIWEIHAGCSCLLHLQLLAKIG